MEERFKTLAGVSEYVSGIGWFIVAGGLGVFLWLASEVPGQDLYWGALGFSVSVTGLVLVACGQLIRCIRAIEHNTRSVDVRLEALIQMQGGARADNIGDAVAGADHTDGAPKEADVE